MICLIYLFCVLHKTVNVNRVPKSRCQVIFITKNDSYKTEIIFAKHKVHHYPQVHLTAFLLNASGNELLHDFIGTAIDPCHSCICKRLRNRVLPHVTGPTMKLETLIRDLVVEVGEPVLGH